MYMPFCATPVPFSACRAFRRRDTIRLLRLCGIAASSFLCCACVDTAAVQSFSKMAPAATAPQVIASDYAQELDRREEIKLLGDASPAPNLADEDTVREKQVQGILAINGAIREYMQSLGSLAAGGIVQSAASVKQVTSGLSAWQKAMPSLGITNGQISLVGEFVQSVADLVESGYRNAKLKDIIAKSQEPFQTLISLQVQIVSEGIEPSIGEIPNVLQKDYQHVPKYIGEDLQTWKKQAKAKKLKVPQSYMDRSATYRALGASEAHAVQYLLRRSIDEDVARASSEERAAQAYVAALKAIAKAHTTLYEHRSDVLTKATEKQIQPLAKEAVKAFRDLMNAEMAPPSH